MENLLNIREDLERTLSQLDSVPMYLEVLYCQKSINEALFWIGKVIDRIKIEKEFGIN